MNKTPITIGIIGHKDAVITKQHENAIIDLLNDIDRNFPNSPIVLFSQLAKGADTFVAQLFLKQGKEKNRDYRLYVPIPMKTNDYKNDFSGEDRVEFENLLEKSYRCFEIDTTDEDRDLKYRRGGKFVADSSMILIALYDGVENNLIGGTSDLVFYKKFGHFKNEYDKTLSNVQGVVIELNCDRLESKSNRGKQQLSSNIFEELILNKTIEKTLRKVDFGNRVATKLEKKISDNIETLYPDKNESKSQNFLKFSYGLWDSCSEHYQKKYLLNLKLLSAFGLFLLIFFEIYRKETTDEFYPLVIIALAIIVFAIYHKVRGKNEHLFYIENRILAESIRVQFFWDKAKIKEEVTKYILRIHKKEYSWISDILNAIQGLSYPEELNNSIVDFGTIEKYWIEDQKDYFQNNLERIKRISKRHKRTSSILIGLSIIIFLLIFIIEITGEYREIESYLILAISLLIGCFILSKGYYEKRGFNQIFNQYDLMWKIFKTTKEKIQSIKSSSLSDEEKEVRIQQLFFLAGKEALVEKGNWYSIFKDKELELEGI